MFLSDPEARHDQINAKIVAGLQEACYDTVQFTESFSREVDAEYLVTVNIAKQIALLNNKGIGWPLKVYLESCATSFKRECTPPVAKAPAGNFLGYEVLLRRPTNVERKGRIDIAIFREGAAWDIPVCAIEVKSFNPDRKLVVADMKRNAEYFRSSNTGVSQLEFAVVCGLHRYDDTHGGAAEQKARTLYSRMAAELRSATDAAATSLKIQITTLQSGNNNLFDAEPLDVGDVQPEPHFLAWTITQRRSE